MLIKLKEDIQTLFFGVCLEYALDFLIYHLKLRYNGIYRIALILKIQCLGDTRLSQRSQSISESGEKNAAF